MNASPPTETFRVADKYARSGQDAQVGQAPGMVRIGRRNYQGPGGDGARGAGPYMVYRGRVRKQAGRRRHGGAAEDLLARRARKPRATSFAD